jgi:hypothetical protein
MEREEFFRNQVVEVVDDVTYEVIASATFRGEASTPTLRSAARTTIVPTLTALVVGGLLTFSSIAAAGPKERATARARPGNAIVRVQVETVPHVPIPPAQREAASRFRRIFREVPLSDAEKLPVRDVDS